MSIMELKAVSYAFDGGDDFIRDINAKIDRGKLTCLIGLNGSGKTTLMRLMARLITPSRGGITLDERPLKDYSGTELARRMAFVPQKTAPAFDMTVLTYVLTGRTPFLGPLSSESKADADIALEALESVGILPLADRDLDTLSGGETQRAMMAKAICQTPELMLLDEPVSSLDIAHSLDVMSLLRRLVDGQGKTALVVMHDLTLAAHFADKLFVMHHGRLVLAGESGAVIRDDSLEDIYNTPLKLIRDGDAHYVCAALPPRKP